MIKCGTVKAQLINFICACWLQKALKHWVSRKALDCFGHIDSYIGSNRYDDVDDNNNK